MAVLVGTIGADILTGIDNETNDITGNGGDDVITGANLADILRGNGGNDILRGLDGADTLRGGDGDDDLFGGTGDDLLDSGSGDDELSGDIGDDRLSLAGGLAGDRKNANGGAGDDVITAGLGNDRMNGGAGQDQANYGSSVIAAAVTVNLQTGIGGGAATGDTYTLIEDVRATIYDDNLTGNGTSNVLYARGGNDIVAGGAGGDYLDGGGGNDTLSYRASDTRVVIDLALGTAVGGDAQGDQLFFFENVFGSDASDRLSGDLNANVLSGYLGNDVLLGREGSDTLHGHGGNDILKGGTGDDFLTGHKGADRLYGETGTDMFVYASVADSRSYASLRDIIFDFNQADDKIDLSAIDANSGNIGNQAFTFRGTAAFTGVSGQLRYVEKVSDTYIYGDTNGDKLADFAIRLDDAITMVAGDFVL